MRWVATIVCAGVALGLGARGAAAQPSDREAVLAAGAEVVREEARRVEIVPRKGPIFGVHAGYHGDVAGMLELRAGWGTGRARESIYLPVTRMWRVSAAARAAYGRADTVAVSLLAGRSVVGILGFSLEAGLDARVVGPGDPAFGPLVSAALRSGKAGLHVNAWTHLVEDGTDWGFSLALGMSFGDSIGAGDVVRKRAKARLGF